MPFEILGTNVIDKASGFTGMGVEFVRHFNGCFHVVVQPSGVSSKTKLPIKPAEFDLRQCTGPKIIEPSQADLAKSKEEKPSPDGETHEPPLPACAG